MKSTKQNVQSFEGKAPLQCPDLDCRVVAAEVTLYINEMHKVCAWQCVCGFENHISI